MVVSHDTEYWSVRIYNTSKSWQNIRILNIDGWFESATFTDEEKKYELVFDYTKLYNKMLNWWKNYKYSKKIFLFKWIDTWF